MAPRKGNMMTVRNDVKVLDATIRTEVSATILNLQTSL